MGPILGLAVLRDANRMVQKPGDEVNWWTRCHKVLFWNAVIVCISAVVFGLLSLGFAAILGLQNWELSGYFCNGMVWGSFMGAFGATFGPFGMIPNLLNKPEHQG